MKRSSAGTRITVKTAKNYFFLNQFATPGLGSLMAKRWLVGTGQLFLFVTGCVMIVMYLFQLDVHAYGQATGEFEPDPHGWLGGIGVIFFATAWIWALMTSLSLIREAEKNRNIELGTPPVLK